MSIPDQENGGLFTKLSNGKLRDLNTRDGMDAAEMALGLSPYGDLVNSLALNPAMGVMEAREKESWFSKTFHMKARHVAKRSRIISEEVKELDDLWKHGVGGGLTSSAGAFAGAAAVGTAAETAGAAVGTMVMPVVGTAVGWGVGAAGTMVGAMGGHWVYNALMRTQQHEAVAIVIKMAEAQQQGKNDFPPEAAFAVLAANLPKKQRQVIEKDLKKMTGTKYFHKALADGKDEALNTLMHKYNDVIRNSTGMPFDPKRTVAEQFAEAINNGLPAQELLFNRSSTAAMMALEARTRERAAGMDMVRTPQDLPSLNNSHQWSRN